MATLAELLLQSKYIANEVKNVAHIVDGSQTCENAGTVF